MEEPISKRILPALTETNRFFWLSGKDGLLRFLRCTDCAFYIHPPGPICPRCLNRNLKPEPVSGKAVVATYSVNHQPWVPGLKVPYVVAIVEVPEQSGLRLTTNIVNCAIDKVHIGMPVRVVFLKQDDVYLPLFEPDKDGTAGL